MARILIVFGTTDGHTARIASALSDALSQDGATVTVTPPHKYAPDPNDYDAVVVAASVHAGRFQKQVFRWVQTHAARLNRMPTAFVSVSLGILQKDPVVQKE